jgi:hypothetical protein
MRRKPLIFLIMSVVVITLVLLVWPRLRPRISEEELQRGVVATIQRESKASFLVTGELEIVATTSVQNTRRVLPQLLDFSLGTSTARIQVPGRAHYGFDVRKLQAPQIQLAGDTIVIRVPQPEVFSVEPNLSAMQVWTEKGWARTGTSVRRAERSAMALINSALMRQAKIHVASSTQPHVNTAEALQVLLTPIVKTFGIDDPVFRFRIGERIIVEP